MNTIHEVGENAGKIWRVIGEHGALTTTEMVKNTGLSNESVYSAIGWLAKENKIVVNKQGTTFKYDLNNTEKTVFHNTTNFNKNTVQTRNVNVNKSR